MKTKIQQIKIQKLLIFCFLCLSSGIYSQKNNVEISDIWLRGTFFPDRLEEIRSLNDGKHFTVLEDRGSKITKFSYETGKAVEKMLDIKDIKNVKIRSIGDYAFSKDESKILFYTNRERIYRRSFTADYYVYDINTKKTSSLSDKKGQRLATFSPDGTKVAFVWENNLYYKDLNTGDELQITTDGEYNKIQNGTPDWVYEEEFSFNQAFEWSPDSKLLAFVRFDESKVKMFTILQYEGMYPQRKKNALYPKNMSFKYPKAGEDNSLVSVHVYDLEAKKTKNMNIGKETDIYVPRIRWTNTSEKLSIFRLNRLQNHFEILFANPKSGETKVIYSEKNKYYIHESNFDNIIYLSDNQHFVITNESDGFCHLYLYDLSGKMVRQLTKGNYEVTAFYGYDEKTKSLYYQAAEESPLRREVYSIKLNGKKKKKMSVKSGTNSAEFSKGFQYYINSFSNSVTPPIYTLYNAKGKEIRVLEDNSALKERLAKFNHAKKEFFTLTTDEGVKLNAWMIKPVNFDPTKKYPVLVTQYSGPNSQRVLDQWEFGWEQTLAGKAYIVACVDPRGTGARGQAFCKATYKQLGKYETLDLIEFAKWLGKQNYVDKERIGIWGWSYGGFMSLLCMTKGAEYYKAGIATAPVTNWRYYDNIYTERFMQKPQNNEKGYDDNSPIFFADKLKGKLLICHGSADDNVHIQNSWEMIEKLVQADKHFEMQFYNNRNHSIYGGNTRNHIFSRFVKFLDENLMK